LTQNVLLAIGRPAAPELQHATLQQEAVPMKIGACA
jgi:hypothetical protein